MLMMMTIDFIILVKCLRRECALFHCYLFDGGCYKLKMTVILKIGSTDKELM